MSESFRRSYEIIFRRVLRYSGDDSVQVVAVRVSKEYRLHVCIEYAHMFHSVFLFVAAREFVLFNSAFQIIIHPCSDNQTVLRLFLAAGKRVVSQDRLGIYIVFLLLVLHEPSVLAEQFELLHSGIVHTRIMFVRSRFEIDFRFDDMIKGFGISGSFSTRFL